MGHGIPTTNKTAPSHYYPPEAMPLIFCGAILMVVLESSDRARAIFNQIVETYRLPDIQAAFNKLELELPPGEVVAMWNENIEDLKIRHPDNTGRATPLLPDRDFIKRLNDMTSKYSHVFAEWFDLERDKVLSVDFRYWLGLIEELIRVGFNSASDQASGIYKLTPATSPRLVLAIHLSAFAQHNRVGVVNDEKTKAVSIHGTTHDLTRFLAEKPGTREHHIWVQAYKRAGYTLWHDDKIARMASMWYQCRVVYSGPQEFCMKMRYEDIAWLEPSNVSIEIRECDYAIGYPRGN